MNDSHFRIHEKYYFVFMCQCSLSELEFIGSNNPKNKCQNDDEYITLSSLPL